MSKPDVQNWILENTSANTEKLAFAKNPFPTIDYKQLLNQVTARAKSKDKLPTWFGKTGIVYPSKVSVEQTSSEKTARYKANLVSGDNLIDLTGGFGVDDYYFSKVVTNVVHCELDSALSDIATHNFKVLGVANISCKNGNSTEILRMGDGSYDWIYVDPSRRNDAKGKVFMLADCLPNVPELLDFYFSYSDNILIKAAPLLDISAALSELKHVKHIHIVSVANEVKELLFVLKNGFDSAIEITASNLLQDSTQTFQFRLSEHAESNFGKPLEFLYEPNPAIYKSGAFDLVGTRFGLQKLHPNSHLYTSDDLIADFPGRIFKIEHCLPYDKPSMKAHLQGKKANVSVRNFPESVEKLRSKWKISDGGDRYCFFTTVGHNDKIVLLSRKIT
nr:class I SAM-dependent methyltransferase [Flavobacterium selenitireducens]